MGDAVHIKAGFQVDWFDGRPHWRSGVWATRNLDETMWFSW
jgi:hypothetical protein